MHAENTFSVMEENMGWAVGTLQQPDQQPDHRFSYQYTVTTPRILFQEVADDLDRHNQVAFVHKSKFARNAENTFLCFIHYSLIYKIECIASEVGEEAFHRKWPVLGEYLFQAAKYNELNQVDNPFPYELPDQSVVLSIHVGNETRLRDELKDIVCAKNPTPAQEYIVRHLNLRGE